MTFCTYFLYEDFYSEIRMSDNIILPISYLKKEENLDDLIENILKTIDLEIVLKNISKIDMQSHKLNSGDIDYILFKESKNNVFLEIYFKNRNDKFLVTNKSLMFLKNILVKRIKNIKTAPLAKKVDAGILVQLLLLANNKIEFLEKVHLNKIDIKENILLFFLRSYPCFDYFPSKNSIQETILIRWIGRYKEIFCMVKDSDWFDLDEINLNINNEKYYQGILFILGIYFLCSGHKDYPDFISIKDLGNFEFGYIVNILQDISKEYKPQQIVDLQSLEKESYDNPVFILDNGTIIFLNITSLIENLTRSVKFLLKDHLSKNLPPKTIYANYWGNKYGKIVEKYFHRLMYKIFYTEYKSLGGEKKEEEGWLMVDNDEEKVLILFEFTTEKFTRDSLWNSIKLEKLIDRLLLKDKKGKLFNLANYVKSEGDKYKNIRVVPILVTEFYIGNFFLLEELTNNMLTRKINEYHELYPLRSNPVILLSLDDMETFWGLISPTDNGKTRAKKFLNFLIQWNNIIEKQQRVPLNLNGLLDTLHTYSFCNFILAQKEKEVNLEPQNFFKIDLIKENIK